MLTNNLHLTHAERRYCPQRQFQTAEGILGYLLADFKFSFKAYKEEDPKKEYLDLQAL